MHRITLVQSNPLVKMISLLCMILMIVFSKSPLFIIVITLMTFIGVLINSKSLKYYVHNIVNICPMIVFIVLLVLFTVKDVNYIMFIYKTILLSMLIVSFMILSSFDGLNSSLYILLKPLSIIGLDVEKISFNISISIYYLLFFINSKDNVRMINKKNNIHSINPKYFISRLLMTNERIANFKLSLKLKFYRVKRCTFSKADIVFIVVFVLFTIFAFIKEVMM